MERIKRDIIHSTHIREVDGQIVVTAPADVQRRLESALDGWDREAFEDKQIRD